MSIFDSSQDSIVRVISKATLEFYENKNGEYNMNKFLVDVNYWPDVNKEDLSKIPGMANELTRKIFDKGLNYRLSPLANTFIALVDGDYKGVTRVRAKIVDLGILRGILHSGPESLSRGEPRIIIPRNEHEVWFYKYNAWRGEFNDWVNFVSERL